MVATSNLFYVFDFISNGQFDDAVNYIPATGGAPVSEGTDVGDAAGVFKGLAIDSAAGVYFITSQSGTNSFIYEEHFGQAPQFTTPLGGAPVSTNLITNSVTSIALDTADDILYFTSGTGFFEEKFAGADYSGSPSLVQLATLPNSTTDASQQLVFDQADHTAYFASPGFHKTFTTVATSHGGSKVTTLAGVSRNFIYKVSNVTSSATANSLNSQVSTVNLGGPNGQLPFSDGVISAVTLDSSTDTLYIATKSGSTATSNAAGVYAYKIGTGQISTVWSETVSSSTQSLDDITNITIDPTTGDYYVSDGFLSKHPGIYVGNVNSHAAPTILFTDPASNPPNGDSTVGLAIDTPPTVTGVAVHAIDGSTSHTTGTVTTADTVTISVGFSQNVFVTGTPTLVLNDGGSASYVSGSGSNTLLYAYTPASGQNAATLATTGAVGPNGVIADSAATSANLGSVAHSFTGLRVQTTPPQISVTGASGDAIEGGAAANALQSDSLSDANGPGGLAQAKVTIVNAHAGDKLSLPGISGGTVDSGVITVTGAGTSTLTLTGSASLSVYQSLLASVTFQDTGTDATTVGSHPARTLNWTVDDGVLNSTASTSTVTIDRAPSVTAGASPTFDGGQSSPVALDSALALNDLDGGNLTGATVTIASGFIAGDTLNFTTQNGISGVQNGDHLTLSGSATVAQYQAALQSVSYSFSPGADDPTNGGGDASRTIDWTADDGVVSSAAATSTLNVVHEPPVLNAAGSVNYAGNGPPVAIDPTLTLSDPDSGGLLQSATVQISSGFLAGDVLAAGAGLSPSITASYDGAGKLTLSGPDTLAHYQAALQGVTFSSTGPDVTNGGTDTSRTISWSINDGVATNATPQTSTVNAAPCYCRGARILTERGEVAVEDLAVGDGVVTARGETRPIVWIGHREIEVARHAFPLEILPVRVRAGAFGRGLPHRDLWLSPQHAVYVDGVLIPIVRLANGASVAQTRVERVDYYHVELESHDVLLAEGLAAESFLDCGSRSSFANAEGFVDLHPTFRPKSWDDACAPLTESGEKLEATRARLLAQAEKLGFRRCEDPGLHILADGEAIWPQTRADGWRLFDLPPGAKRIALASRVWRPADDAPDGDKRRLGVAVNWLELDGLPWPLAELGEGWQDIESEDGREWRWTDGHAVLPAGARRIRLCCGAGPGYWIEARPKRAAA